MKFEFSAGGLVVRKYKSVWQLLLMKDMNDSWTFPKGLIEKSEKPHLAATREINEEVGVTGLKLRAELNPIEYWYRRNGLIRKKVYYFLFEVKGNPAIKVQKEEGISEAKWFDFEEAAKVIGYADSNKKLIARVRKLLSAK